MQTYLKFLPYKIPGKMNVLVLLLFIAGLIPEKMNAQAVQTTITDCFSRSAVIGDTHTGGLIGSVAGSVVVERTYSAGLIPGIHATKGGLIGTKANEVNVVNSYWDTNVTTQAQSAGGEGRPTSAMTRQPATQAYQSWSFSTVWTYDNQARNSGYPFLAHSLPITYNLSLGYNNPTYGYVSGSGQYGQGTLVRITATPRSDNAFVRWTDIAQQEVSNLAQLDIEMPANELILMAHFTYSTDIQINEVDITQIFPNPFGNTLTVYNNEAYEYIHITNLHGQKMLTLPLGHDSQQVVDTSWLPSGIYLISLHKPNHPEKVIKMIKGR